MPSSAPEDWADRVREGLRELQGQGQPDTEPIRLDRYTLQERLGEGATAVVYAARDRELERDVAIKVLRESSGLSNIARERFRREAQVAAGLSHPNLVTVYDAGTVEGHAYLVMERVQGRSLGDLLREERSDTREIVRILERAARGVAAAHEKGIVHRDLKPANILLSTSGEPKVGDFGMVHLMDSRVELTKTGVPLGTPLYMAPEQVQGRTQDISPRTDVYGLGAILYEALVGRPPHYADSIVEVYAKIARDEPAPPRSLKPNVPPELEAVALKALDKEPGRRYATAALFADDLARYLEGAPVLARRASPAYRLYRRLQSHRRVVAAAVAALLVITGILLAGHHRTRALEEDRRRDREAADERLRQATQSSVELSRAREESLRRLTYLWGRIVAVHEWRQQPSRKTAEIRQEIEGLLREVSTYIAQYPEVPQGHYVRARARFFSGDLKGAEADVTRALELAPDFSPGWSLLGHVKLEQYVYRGYAWSPRDRNLKRQEAEPILREAEAALRRTGEGASGQAAASRWGLSWTREDAVNETLVVALKECYVEKNREGAKARIQRAHTESPTAEYCVLLGNWSGVVDLAEPWLDKAVAIAPHWARPYLDRGVIRSVRKEREKAIEDFDRAIEINPNLAIAYDNRAVQRLALKEFKAAIQDCTRAIELDPSMDFAFLHRAEARRLTWDFKGSLQDNSDAIALFPRSAQAWTSRGLLLTAMGELDRASSDLDRAIELDPQEPVGYINRALHFQVRGDFTRMAQDCDKALQVSPPDWEGRAYIEQLKAQAKRP